MKITDTRVVREREREFETFSLNFERVTFGFNKKSYLDQLLIMSCSQRPVVTALCETVVLKTVFYRKHEANNLLTVVFKTDKPNSGF